MTSFSERFGIESPKVELALAEMPSSLRNGLWDITRIFFFDDIGSDGSFHSSPEYSESFNFISRRLQFDFFRLSFDDMDLRPSVELERIKGRFYKLPYNRVYDFLEFLMKENDQGYLRIDSEGFRKLCNEVMARERVRLRIAGIQFIQVTDDNEIIEIERAIENNISKAVSEHISAAAALLSRMPSPDFRNSIKESVSAVEAAVRFVTGKKTHGVGKPLKMIEDEFQFHPALREGFEKIFAFSSDESGVRHALMEGSRVTRADAKFMLIACSAFSNYLLTLKCEQEQV